MVLCSDRPAESLEYWLQNPRTLCRIGLVDERSETQRTSFYRSGVELWRYQFKAILGRLKWPLAFTPMRTTEIAMVTAKDPSGRERVKSHQR
ncbi:hypothetical protein FKM82_003900 [Ascaphus truei]